MQYLGGREGNDYVIRAPISAPAKPVTTGPSSTQLASQAAAVEAAKKKAAADAAAKAAAAAAAAKQPTGVRVPTAPGKTYSTVPTTFPERADIGQGNSKALPDRLSQISIVGGGTVRQNLDTSVTKQAVDTPFPIPDTRYPTPASGNNMMPIQTAAITPQTPIPASGVVPKSGTISIPSTAPSGYVNSYGGPMPMDYSSPTVSGQVIEPEKSSITMPLILGGIAVAALLIFRSKK
jgi:hypothetical protein